MKLRVGTWNIAGGRKVASSAKFDYEASEDLAYFAGQLRKLDLDVVCLQESHEDDSLARRLAGLLAMPYAEETIGCPSHIDILYNLNTAILSRVAFDKTAAFRLPRPTFTLQFAHDERVVQPYERYMQVIDFGAFRVATLWTEPLGAFGRSYEHGEGALFAKQIDELITAKLDRPVIMAADFNTEDVPRAFPFLVSKHALREALPDQPTKPQGHHPDHILHSPEWRRLASGVVQTQSDHYLCWAEFEL